MSTDGTVGFDEFVATVEPRLRQALVGLCGVEEARDAVQETLVYAWRHWPRVSEMDNPGGYLYRVARSRIRWPRRLPRHADSGPDGRLPEIEPRLATAMAGLTDRQRVAVFLVVGCDWTHEDVATWMGISVSSLRNHLARGTQRLRDLMGVTADV